MNEPIASHPEAALEPSPRLLDKILSLRATVGDVLNDDECTRLLRRKGTFREAGFEFVSFSDGCVTFGVPEQDLARWYPEEGWIMPEKERIARTIAAKHGLTLYEPPDMTSNSRRPLGKLSNSHHHLELSDGVDSIIVAHPRYLKIRLFRSNHSLLSPWDAQDVLPLGPELLQDLSALYRE